MTRNSAEGRLGIPDQGDAAALAALAGAMPCCVRNIC